jgi:hypothetical protein
MRLSFHRQCYVAALLLLGVMRLWQIEQSSHRPFYGYASATHYGLGLSFKTTPSRIRISSVLAENRLVKKTRPVAPPRGTPEHVTGTVVLYVLVGKDGTVQSVSALSGPPMLYAYAIDAVRQWHYSPYLLDGQPVEFETTVNLLFT